MGGQKTGKKGHTESRETGTDIEANQRPGHMKSQGQRQSWKPIKGQDTKSRDGDSRCSQSEAGTHRTLDRDSNGSQFRGRDTKKARDWDIMVANQRPGHVKRPGQRQ